MKPLRPDFACLCDNSHTDAGGKLNIIGIFENIFAKKFPAVHPQMVLSATFFIDSQEKEFDFTFKVQIIEKGKSEPIQKIEGTSDVRREDVKNNQKFNFILNFQNVEFKNPGDYYLEIYLNDELVKTCDFGVVKLESVK
ncbi:MAG: hypothetical protein OEL89_04335 [Candidatus Peregrinibacteria bacterium]|nr:hypothetical protein [Candidatus Peregrinibacteria bacterium]